MNQLRPAAPGKQFGQAQPSGRQVPFAPDFVARSLQTTGGYALVPVRKHLAPRLVQKPLAANVILFMNHRTKQTHNRVLRVSVFLALRVSALLAGSRFFRPLAYAAVPFCLPGLLVLGGDETQERR